MDSGLTIAIVLFVVGGVLVIIAFILIMCLVCRYRRKKDARSRGKDVNDEFRMVYKPKKKHKQETHIQTIDMIDGNGTLVKNNRIVASNGTMLSSNGTHVMAGNGTLIRSNQPKTVTPTATYIPATVVVPHGSTLNVDKTKNKRRIPSDASSHRVVYQTSNYGTKPRTLTRPSHHHHQQQRAYSSSYAYGTTGRGNYHASSPEIGALVLSGDVHTGKLKVLGEMPREGRVRRWLHRQNADGVRRAASNDALDADHRSLPSDVFESSAEGDHANNALKMRWSPWMERKIRKSSESESYVDQRTLPAHYERKYIYPQYTGKAMSSL